MQFPLNSSLSHTIFRLGTWYGLYRLIIAVSLNIILVLTDAQIDNSRAGYKNIKRVVVDYCRFEHRLKPK
ncbi:MAG TPA: hypothetical protein DEF26_02455 [Acinetobacter sp.]|nr:hypothetical protein [Acinetobacter sp.]